VRLLSTALKIMAERPDLQRLLRAELNAAANRDPRRFEDPGTFDVARPNARQHLAFGRGIHTCPGAPLARAEARVSLERLLDRTSDIRISEPRHGPADARRYRYLPTYILRGLTLTAAGNCPEHAITVS
jgi:hypothetical protein